MFARFLEENFVIRKNDHILNIGIGAGYWDRYLSYKVPDGSLTSIDIDRSRAENFAACLKNENNNTVEVICADAIIKKAISVLKDTGALYLQILHKDADFDIDRFCQENKASITNRFIDDTYDIHSEYYRIVKL